MSPVKCSGQDLIMKRKKITFNGVSENNIVERVRKIVENDCRSKNNYFGYSAWTHHIAVVVKFSLKLAKKLKADIETVELAALLHDWSGIKNVRFYEEHHVHSARMAGILLSRLGYSKDRIERVKRCIYSHRASQKIKRVSIEEKCLASADAMSHITELPDLMFLAYGVRKLKTKEGAKFVLSKIERSWEKLIPEAKKMVKNDYQQAKKILLRTLNNCSTRN